MNGNYLRLCGYSILLYFRDKASEDQRRRFVVWVGLDLAGKGGWPAFKEKFSGDCKDIERAWENYCLPEQETKPKAAEKPKLADPVGPQPAVLAVAPAPPTPKSLVFDLAPQNLVELRAEMIRKIRHRQFSQALAALYTERDSKQAHLLSSVFSEEKDSVEKALPVYKALSESLRTGDKLPVGLGLQGEIGQLDAEKFELKTSKGSESHAWNELDLRGALSFLSSNLKPDDAKMALTIAESWLWCGEISKAKQTLRASGHDAEPEGKELAARFPDFETASKEAALRDELETLSKVEQPIQAMDDLKKFFSPPFPDSEFFKRSRPFFKEMLKKALEQLFEKKEFASLFKGRSSGTASGEIKVAYLFDTAAELEDWTVDPKHPSLSKVSSGPTKPNSRAPEFRCRGGTLQMTAPLCLLHFAPWVGDITVDWSYAVVRPEVLPDDPSILFAIGLCDDGKGNFLFNNQHNGLIRVHPDKLDRSKGATVTKFQYDTFYSLKLRRTGNNFRLLWEGQETANLADPELKGSKLFFFALGGFAYTVGGVTITGKLDPKWLEEKREAWVARELQAIVRE